MIFIDLASAIDFNKRQIEMFGGIVGVRDINLLKSALEMPKQGFGDHYFHEFPFEIAAAYIFYIAKNHPFLDGNKRTALQVGIAFLYVNGYTLKIEASVLTETMVDVATGKTDKKALAVILEKHAVRL